LQDLLDSLVGQYHLGIVTAGERWVQERRLRDFHLQSKFKAIEIVDAKTGAVFRQYCEKHGIDIPKSWVVGDSVNSDVLPALAAGLRAVHLQAENWHHVEGQPSSLPDGVPSVRSILEIKPLLLSTST
jgi:putative hydrolase of the HAD superfamily